MRAYGRSANTQAKQERQDLRRYFDSMTPEVITLRLTRT